MRELDPVAPAEGAGELLLGGGDAEPGLVGDVIDAASGQQLGQRPGLGRDLGGGLGPGRVIGRAGRVGQADGGVDGGVSQIGRGGCGAALC